MFKTDGGAVVTGSPEKRDHFAKSSNFARVLAGASKDRINDHSEKFIIRPAVDHEF